MADLIVEAAPTDRVVELFAWVAVHANGGEGIISHTFVGIGTTPLVTSRPHVAQLLGHTARAVAAAAGDKVQRVELRRFVLMGTVQ